MDFPNPSDNNTSPPAKNLDPSPWFQFDAENSDTESTKDTLQSSFLKDNTTSNSEENHFDSVYGDKQSEPEILEFGSIYKEEDYQASESEAEKEGSPLSHITDNWPLYTAIGYGIYKTVQHSRANQTIKDLREGLKEALTTREKESPDTNFKSATEIDLDLKNDAKSIRELQSQFRQAEARGQVLVLKSNIPGDNRSVRAFRTRETVRSFGELGEKPFRTGELVINLDYDNSRNKPGRNFLPISDQDLKAAFQPDNEVARSTFDTIRERKKVSSKAATSISEPLPYDQFLDRKINELSKSKLPSDQYKSLQLRLIRSVKDSGGSLVLHKHVDNYTKQNFPEVYEYQKLHNQKLSLEGSIESKEQIAETRFKEIQQLPAREIETILSDIKRTTKPKDHYITHANEALIHEKEIRSFMKHFENQPAAEREMAINLTRYAIGDNFTAAGTEEIWQSALNDLEKMDSKSKESGSSENREVKALEQVKLSPQKRTREYIIFQDYTEKEIGYRLARIELPKRKSMPLDFKTSEGQVKGDYTVSMGMHQMATDELYEKAGIKKPEFKQLPAIYEVTTNSDGKKLVRSQFNVSAQQAAEFIGDHAPFKERSGKGFDPHKGKFAGLKPLDADGKIFFVDVKDSTVYEYNGNTGNFNETTESRRVIWDKKSTETNQKPGEQASLSEIIQNKKFQDIKPGVEKILELAKDNPRNQKTLEKLAQDIVTLKEKGNLPAGVAEFLNADYAEFLDVETLQEGAQERVDEAMPKQESATKREHMKPEILKQRVSEAFESNRAEIGLYEQKQAAKQAERYTYDILRQHFPGVEPTEVRAGNESVVVKLNDGTALKFRTDLEWDTSWGTRSHDMPLESIDGKEARPRIIGEGPEKMVVYRQKIVAPPEPKQTEKFLKEYQQKFGTTGDFGSATDAAERQLGKYKNPHTGEIEVRVIDYAAYELDFHGEDLDFKKSDVLKTGEPANTEQKPGKLESQPDKNILEKPKLEVLRRNKNSLLTESGELNPRIKNSWKEIVASGNVENLTNFVKEAATISQNVLSEKIGSEFANRLKETAGKIPGIKISNLKLNKSVGDRVYFELELTHENINNMKLKVSPLGTEVIIDGRNFSLANTDVIEFNRIHAQFSEDFKNSTLSRKTDSPEKTSDSNTSRNNTTLVESTESKAKNKLSGVPKPETLKGAKTSTVSKESNKKSKTVQRELSPGEFLDIEIERLKGSNSEKARESAAKLQEIKLTMQNPTNRKALETARTKYERYRKLREKMSNKEGQFSKLGKGAGLFGAAGMVLLGINHARSNFAGDQLNPDPYEERASLEAE